jgi:hypothetical protein
VEIPVFQVGTRNPVNLTFVQIDLDRPARAKLLATDIVGNTASCEISTRETRGREFRRGEASDSSSCHRLDDDD